LKETLARHARNFPGWRTKKKLLVIESDDWGGIRMPSSAVYIDLLTAGIHVDKCPYNTFDNLESTADLQALYETLGSVTDSKGNPAILTANYNVVNPDFDKIKASGFTEYYFHPFTQTLKEYYPSEDIFGLVKEGIANKTFFPQYHAREHINPLLWLQLLREGHEALLKAFDMKLYGLSFITSPTIKKPYLASLIYMNDEEKRFTEHAIIEGADIFQKIFGFRSTSFIAPLYTWAFELEDAMAKGGIKYIQGANFHKLYSVQHNKRSIHRHPVGSKSASGQYYLSRNCLFEPSLTFRKKDAVGSCMKEIASSFLWRKPAIISAHRLNFMGGLHEKNRTENLKNLKALLSGVVRRWPDVEFVTTPQVGALIESTN
jgi:hypothetical protein